MDSLLLFKSAKTLAIPGISVTGIPPLRDQTSINLLNHPSSRRRCSQKLAMIRRNAAFDPLRMKAASVRLPAATGPGHGHGRGRGRDRGRDRGRGRGRGRGRDRGRGRGRGHGCDGCKYELKGGCNIFVHILAVEVVKIGGNGVKVKTSLVDVEATNKTDKVASSGLVEVAKKKTSVIDVEATKKLDKVESSGLVEVTKKKTDKVESTGGGGVDWASIISCLAAVLRLWALCAEFILLVTGD